jgi:hypothetical protein
VNGCFAVSAAAEVLSARMIARKIFMRQKNPAGHVDVQTPFPGSARLQRAGRRILRRQTSLQSSFRPRWHTL